MDSPYTTQSLRDAVLQYYTSIGTPLNRIGVGQRWVVELPNGEFANLKASVTGAMMTSAKGPNASDELIGMGDDVSRVLCAMRLPDTEKVELYNVPKDQVIEHYRTAHAIWQESHPQAGENKTRVCYFRPVKSKLADAYVAKKWKAYHVASIELKKASKSISSTSEGVSISPNETVARAKEEVAAAYGIAVDQVTISVSL